MRLAREQHPALILMDIQLPGHERHRGARASCAADAATRDIPVIAVTASAMTHDRQKIMAAGFDGYQTKPISVKAFLEAVRADAWTADAGIRREPPAAASWSSTTRRST